MEENNHISYLKGRSATALVSRARIFPNSSDVSTGHSEHSVISSSLTLRSSMSAADEIKPSSFVSQWPFLLDTSAAVAETRSRNRRLSFRDCSL